MAKPKPVKRLSLPLNNRSLSRGEMVLLYLKTIYINGQYAHPGQRLTDGASSALLSRDFGIRNVPDVIRKLRKKGHDIRTRLVKDVHSGAHKYPLIAIYYLASLDDTLAEGIDETPFVNAANPWGIR